MDEEKLRSYYVTICDAWRFMKMHASGKDTDEFWKKTIDESVAFMESHDDQVFAKRIVTAVVGALHDEIGGKK